MTKFSKQYLVQSRATWLFPICHEKSGCHFEIFFSISQGCSKVDKLGWWEKGAKNLSFRDVFSFEDNETKLLINPRQQFKRSSIDDCIFISDNFNNFNFNKINSCMEINMNFKHEFHIYVVYLGAQNVLLIYKVFAGTLKITENRILFLQSNIIY